MNTARCCVRSGEERSLCFSQVAKTAKDAETQRVAYNLVQKWKAEVERARSAAEAKQRPQWGGGGVAGSVAYAPSSSGGVGGWIPYRAPLPLSSSRATQAAPGHAPRSFASASPQLPPPRQNAWVPAPPPPLVAPLHPPPLPSGGDGKLIASAAASSFVAAFLRDSPEHTALPLAARLDRALRRCATDGRAYGAAAEAMCEALLKNALLRAALLSGWLSVEEAARVPHHRLMHDDFFMNT